jgi:hypothetical protein
MTKGRMAAADRKYEFEAIDFDFDFDSDFDPKRQGGSTSL